MLCMWVVTTHSILYRIHVHMCTCMCVRVAYMSCSLSQERTQNSCHEREKLEKSQLTVYYTLPANTHLCVCVCGVCVCVYV